MPPVVTASDYLVLNSVPLATPAWRIVGLSPLLDDAPFRWENYIVPGADGRLAGDASLDEWPLAFNMIIDGRYQDDGTLRADPVMGAVLNREQLASTTGVGTAVTAVWHRRNSTTRTFTVQHRGFTGSTRKTHLIRTVLNLLVPAGVLGAPV